MIITEDIVTQSVLLRVRVTPVLFDRIEAYAEEASQIDKTLDMKVFLALVLVAFNQEVNVIFYLAN
jgi:hypothetical protein